ncbi:MAG: hypothetical protein IJL69_06505, partial [Oscillospiraceae bacterium]|nr:hypothetical protein [Oscillospiraceae bacterium]
LKMATDFTDSLVEAVGGRLVPISEVVDLNDWAGAFANHSWNAYVYAGEEAAAVTEAAIRVLARYRVELDRSRTLSSLKHADEAEEVARQLAAAGYPVK